MDLGEEFVGRECVCDERGFILELSLGGESGKTFGG